MLDSGPHGFIFGHQNKYSSRHNYIIKELLEYNKLNVFYLALTETECSSL